MLCSVAGSAYDVLGYIKPSMGVPHDGMKFSTYDNDNDLLVMNCANFFGGGGWHLKCSIWGPFVTSPMWYSPPHDAWQPMESINMMIKLQWLVGYNHRYCASAHTCTKRYPPIFEDSLVRGFSHLKNHNQRKQDKQYKQCRNFLPRGSLTVRTQPRGSDMVRNSYGVMPVFTMNLRLLLTNESSDKCRADYEIHRAY